ncbi:MAG: hypothetical protein L0191_17610, partial [Acidobacteria bacterium]|nr:hypothetical protein [Acidobacteriota bacterium]
MRRSGATKPVDTAFVLLLVIVASVLSFTRGIPSVASAERVDSVTQRNGMHSCPPGEFATGVHLERNLLLCSDDFGSYAPDTEAVDSGTQQKGWHPDEGMPRMRGCPSGSAVTGLHSNRDLLA